jgi:biopolymer transport protein TolR
MRKNKRRKPMAEINVVPYIDVTLVLLIIFMITTPMLQTGVEVDLPKAESKAVESKDNIPPVIISIDKDRQYFIEFNNEKPTQIEPDEINEKVMAAIANIKEPQIYVKAHGKVDYNSVIQVFTALKNTGIPNVGLMTQADDKQ